MWSRVLGLASAAAATLLVVGVGAAIFAPLIYFILVFLEGMIEAVGVISRGWGAAHDAFFLWTDLVLIGAAAIYCGVWYFRRAMAVEMELRRGDPPTAT